MKDVSEALNENFWKFMEDGPRLRMDYNVVVVMVCSCGDVMLGGLGGMGMGQMWVKGEDRHKDYIGYDAAERAMHVEGDVHCWG